MNVSTEEFLKTLHPGKKGRTSKLHKYRDDLEKLAKSGCSVAQMQAFLKLNGLQIGIQPISNFLVKEGLRKKGKRNIRKQATE